MDEHKLAQEQRQCELKRDANTFCRNAQSRGAASNNYNRSNQKVRNQNNRAIFMKTVFMIARNTRISKNSSIIMISKNIDQLNRNEE